MYEANAQSQSRSLVVALGTVALLTLLLVGLLARVVQLQTRPSPDLRQHMTSRVAVRRELPPRGDVTDRNGRPLAVTALAKRVVLDPTVMDPRTLDEDIVRLAEAIGADADALGTQIRDAQATNTRRGSFKPPPAPRAGGLRALLAGAGVIDPPAAPAPQGLIDPPAGEPSPVDANRGPIRFLPVSDLLGETQVEMVKALKIKGLAFEQRPQRQYPAGSAVASIVGLVNVEDRGALGAELRLQEDLSGESGAIRYTHDRSGRPLWMERGQVRPSVPGQDVRLSIDLELQRIAYEELMKGVEDADAAGGRLLIVDPLTGEVLAMVDIVRDLPGLEPFPWLDDPNATPEARLAARSYDEALARRLAMRGAIRDRYPSLVNQGSRKRYITILDADGGEVPALARNRCVEDIYEPGSTFKPFVWSTITELGLLRTDDVLNTEHGVWDIPYGKTTRHIEDVTKRPTMTWAEVLINSSNIGMIKGAQKLSAEQLHGVCARFGFGKPTGIELPGEAAGLVTPLSRWTIYSQTSVAYGHEVAVTPIQMARAFSAFARPGDLGGTLPQVHMRAIRPAHGGRASPVEFQRGVIYRVLPAEIAHLTRQVMTAVAEKVEANMTDVPAAGWRYTMFGKSGTAKIPLSPPRGKRRPPGLAGYFDDQYNSSFMAAGPTENPRLVVLAVIDDPGPSKIAIKHHYGSWVAGPVVRRVMERSLTYLGTPASPVASDAVNR